MRDISLSSSYLKLVTCSDDRTACIFDFATATKEVNFQGHGADVRSCEWHPDKSLIVTGSKDTNVKLWDPKNGREIDTINAHNNIINRVRWNPINGNWLLTGSKDALIKIHDLRMYGKRELDMF